MLFHSKNRLRGKVIHKTQVIYKNINKGKKSLDNFSPKVYKTCKSDLKEVHGKLSSLLFKK